MEHRVGCCRYCYGKGFTERDAAKALAADREPMVATLASPIQRLTDSSMLALQRGGLDMLDAVAARQVAAAIDRGKREAASVARFNIVMDRLEDVPTRNDMNDLLSANQPVIFDPDSPRLSLATSPAKARWGLQIEPFVEGGITPTLQPTLRGGARIWLRKTNTPR